MTRFGDQRLSAVDPQHGVPAARDQLALPQFTLAVQQPHVVFSFLPSPRRFGAHRDRVRQIRCGWRDIDAERTGIKELCGEENDRHRDRHPAGQAAALGRASVGARSVRRSANEASREAIHRIA
jgi:hypothetical protein